MGGIAPLILDLEMQSHDLFNLTSMSVRSSLFSREFTLGLGEVLPGFGAEKIAFLEFTVTGGNLVDDAEINTNLTTCWYKRHRGHIHATHV